MQLLLPTLAAFASLMATAQGFLVPFAAKPTAPMARTARTPMTPLAMSSSPSAAEAAMLSTNPLAGRSVQFSDSEDSDERVTQVRLNPDGSISLISCNTQAVEIKGNWRPGVRGRRGRAGSRTGQNESVARLTYKQTNKQINKQITIGRRQDGLHPRADLPGVGRRHVQPHADLRGIHT